jgi:hypothetical protein
MNADHIWRKAELVDQLLFDQCSNGYVFQIVPVLDLSFFFCPAVLLASIPSIFIIGPILLFWISIRAFGVDLSVFSLRVSSFSIFHS